MAYIQEIVKAGRTIEFHKYYSYNHKSKNTVRQPRTNNTKEAQERINYKRKEKKLTRLLNTNFIPNDYHIVLNYEIENRPENVECMKADIRNFLKKLRKEYKKQNKELKYIHVPQRGVKGALHHHLVINKIDPAILSRCWSKGRVNIHLLDRTGQYRKLAAYLLKYTKTNKEDAKKLGKSWNPSRNLKQPIIIKKVISKHDFFKDKVIIPKKYSDYYIDKETIFSGYHEETGYKYFTYTIVKNIE